ncbi:LLM class oxidoreductase [Actinacidiphila sp. ITFR-21]|uniref:LLM class oxidoreductase n=1 Tax=Actinacidiphila sp. ITFR-21 TaxID=3075199 RepID=UPI00288AF562|nr:LLM class oxidoreductase [Streptomyces sp. ITFR-21]WNI18810.1 LLM class oxidoreductase [Streptomyces sp. ITFR-21]
MSGPAPGGGSALALLAPGPGTLTLGVELPLDNDWSTAGRQRTRAAGRPSGVPDLRHHRERAALADRLGYTALWLRDVPLWDPGFGDAGQVYDPFPYLGHLAAATSRILLGTAAIALPLRHPLHVAKMAASVDRLSDGRLLLGIASGDRPLEYPAFGVDYAERGQAVRDAVRIMREAWRPVPEQDGGPTVRVLPTPAQPTVPLLMAGHGRQSPQWLAAHLDGHFTYHRRPADMRPVAERWLEVCGDTPRPLLTTMFVDLAEDPGAPVRPIRFGARLGRDALTDYLTGLQKCGVAHVALNFRFSERPVEDALKEIAAYVLPVFCGPDRT